MLSSPDENVLVFAQLDLSVIWLHGRPLKQPQPRLLISTPVCPRSQTRLSAWFFTALHFYHILYHFSKSQRHTVKITEVSSQLHLSPFSQPTAGYISCSKSGLDLSSASAPTSSPWLTESTVRSCHEINIPSGSFHKKLKALAAGLGTRVVQRGQSCCTIHHSEMRGHLPRVRMAKQLRELTPNPITATLLPVSKLSHFILTTGPSGRAR